MIELSEIEARVLGSVMEKEMTTPEYYPMTLNAITAACNQKSSREPVMRLEEDKVLFAVARLRENKLIVEKIESGNRSTRYAHQIVNLEPISPAEKAVLCVLLLRGAQTPGEIRGRTGRMHNFADPAEVEKVIHDLMTRFDNPFVEKLPKEPGRKERRYIHLLSRAPQPQKRELTPQTQNGDLEARLAALEERVTNLEKREEPPEPQ